MKSWVKGGLIGVGICALALILLYTIIWISGSSELPILEYFAIAFGFPLFILAISGVNLDFFMNVPNVIWIVTDIILWFLLGALIGWFIGWIVRKLKKKSSRKNKPKRKKKRK